jgi:TolB-like protein
MRDAPKNYDPSSLAGRLDSWKEIAAFLRRDVRTVQRWEKKEGLPVYRHQHEKLGSVYAFRAELTGWLSTRQPSAAIAPAAGQEKTADKIKLAVLPFCNLGGGQEDDYFSDGLTDEMTTELTRLQPAQLAVIARSSAERYEATAESLQSMRQNLGVDYALEGKVRRVGNRVRITARLSEVQDQTQMWAETYERDLSDVLSVQAEIAQAIAQEINLALNLSETDLRRGRRRVEPAAYDAYLNARYHLHAMSPAEIQKGVEDFTRAIAIDATYAPAYAGLASALALLAIAPFDAVPPHLAMPQAEAAARQALQLDDSLAEAHAALALVNHHYHWRWNEAESGYRRAVELNPDYAAARLWHSWLLLALGKQQEAMQEIEHTMRIVQETDPHRLVAVHATRALAFYFGREFQRAAEECEKAQQMDPAHFMLRFVLGRAYMRLGESTKAIEQFQAARNPAGDIPLVDAALGLAYAVSGQKDRAQKMADALTAVASKRYIPPTYFVMLYAGLDDKDQAFIWLEKAFAERADGLTWLGVEPMVDGIRSDHRFPNLLRRIGLPQ